MKASLGLLQLLCMMFLSRFDTTEGRFLHIRTGRNLRSVTLPEGYSIYPGDNVAYKFYTDEKPWQEARARCVSDGGDLANVATLEKRNHTLNVISNVTGWVYVGLYKPAGGQQWISADSGLPVTSSLPWVDYDAADNDWGCGAIRLADGKLTNFLGVFGFNSVCEIRINKTNIESTTEPRRTQPATTEDGTTEGTTQAPAMITLSYGYATYPGYNAAYKFYTDDKTWDEARARCISDGGDLANVATLEKRNHVRNSIRQASNFVWVGIYKQANSQEWISVHNGLPVTSSLPWDIYTNGDSYTRGSIRPSSGRMTNSLGLFSLNSVCEIRIDENKTVNGPDHQPTQPATTEDGTTEGTTQAPAMITLPNGYATYPGYNAAYKLYTDLETWQEARARCISDGGDMANVATLEKRNRMLNVIPRVDDWIHVGLYKPAGGQQWISADDGLPVTSSLPWVIHLDIDRWNRGSIWPSDGLMMNWPDTMTANSVCSL